MKVALTIAGSDPSGGAGIQGDLKTFAAHGVYGCSAITAITVQNTLGVSAVTPVDPALVAAQIDAVAADFDVAAVKTGMLASAPIVMSAIGAINRHGLDNVVVDPVFTSSSGAALLDAAGVDAVRTFLVPFAAVLTPNLAEAERLVERNVRSVDEMAEAAQMLGRMGAAAVVVTGGHLPGRPVDIVYANGQLTELPGERLDSPHTHGTGCAFSAALAARLALGDDVLAAARTAKQYVAEAIRRAPRLGRGRGPLGHF